MGRACIWLDGGGVKGRDWSTFTCGEIGQELDSMQRKVWTKTLPVSQTLEWTKPETHVRFLWLLWLSKRMVRYPA